MLSRCFFLSVIGMFIFSLLQALADVTENGFQFIFYAPEFLLYRFSVIFFFHGASCYPVMEEI